MSWQACSLIPIRKNDPLLILGQIFFLPCLALSDPYPELRLFIGMPLNKDSKRMMMSDIIYGAAERKVGLQSFGQLNQRLHRLVGLTINPLIQPTQLNDSETRVTKLNLATG